MAVRAVEVLFYEYGHEHDGRICRIRCPTVEEIRQGILGCFWQGRMEEVLPGRCMWMVRIMMTASGLFWIPWQRTAAPEAGDCCLVWRRIRIAVI